MARCYDSSGRQYYCRSGWNSWGRWVVLAVILVAAFLFFFLFRSVCFSHCHPYCSTNPPSSFLTARRRRKRGLQPYRGTGWSTAPFGHGPAQYNPNYPSQPPPDLHTSPPAYGANAGYYGGQNQGYFGGQQAGVELQQPQNVHRGGDNVYQPPGGPPPKKADGIVR